MSFTDQTVLTQMQYVMLETPNGGASWGSEMWTAAEVINYLNQRQNRFLKDTQLQIGLALIPATEGTNKYDLPDDWITTVRVVWVSSDDSTRALGRSSSWEADHGMPTWTYVEGPPKLYMDVDTEVLTIKIAPLPDDDGTLQIHYVPLAALLDGTGELMTIPDEFVPTVKYGALADMFGKVGRAMDERAGYCQQRYEMGVEVAKMMLNGWKS